MVLSITMLTSQSLAEWNRGKESWFIIMIVKYIRKKWETLSMTRELRGAKVYQCFKHLSSIWSIRASTKASLKSAKKSTSRYHGSTSSQRSSVTFSVTLPTTTTTGVIISRERPTKRCLKVRSRRSQYKRRSRLTILNVVVGRTLRMESLWR